MKCPNCSSPVTADARFCGECGQALRQLGKSLIEPDPAPPEAAPLPDLSALHTIDGAETHAPKTGSQRVLSPGDIFADRYEVKQIIGEGGMGVVYRAADKLTEKDVALKLIRADRLAGKDAVNRLIREGVTSRDIRHPNVVAVYDVGEVDGNPYMSMEFLSGQSLRSWNRKRLARSLDCSMMAAANIIAEILSGLDAAHKAGVVHRDLKPENVMLVSEPTERGAALKILDFGVARAAGAGDTGATSLGTRGYMAPEQITAPDAALPSADLYSLSVMFYELLVGVLPQGHWQPPSAGRSDVPPSIDKLIERGLSNNPRVRPQSVAEYSRELVGAMNAAFGQTSVPPWLQKLNDTLFRPSGGARAPSAPQAPQPHQPQQAAYQAHAPQAGAGQNVFKLFWDGVTRKYGSGAGRASVKEYWSISIGALVLFLVGVALDVDLATVEVDGFEYQGPIMPAFSIIFLLAMIVPGIAVTARRIHDLGHKADIAKSFELMGAMMSSRGTVGPNAYGPDPLEGAR
ncbi:MAG: protein kinase [Hyphomonadaceae bacterium]